MYQYIIRILVYYEGLVNSSHDIFTDIIILQV